MTRVLLVTANVGSMFEESESIGKWLDQLNETILTIGPQFVAIHCQEMGGKRFQLSMNYVNLFIRLAAFTRVRIFVDEDYDNSATFTALGSLYFARDSLDVHIWDFAAGIFLPVSDRITHLGSIEEIQTKEKLKFPQNDQKLSRKGFMRTRWRLTDVVVDLVNVHLFHDACNLQAFHSQFPSKYAIKRRKAFEYTLDKVTSGQSDIPLFVFGDFNFRLDSRAFIEKFIENPIKEETKDNLVIKDTNNQIIVSIGRKTFDFTDKQLFKTGFPSLLTFDKELNYFSEKLFELDIHFPPSYPFNEDSSLCDQYMTTRCPAWCDRILMNSSARSLVSDYRYSMIGLTEPMGDHKPIFADLVLNTKSFICVKNENKLRVYRQTNIY